MKTITPSTWNERNYARGMVKQDRIETGTTGYTVSKGQRVIVTYDPKHRTARQAGHSARFYVERGEKVRLLTSETVKVGSREAVQRTYIIES